MLQADPLQDRAKPSDMANLCESEVKLHGLSLSLDNARSADGASFRGATCAAILTPEWDAFVHPRNGMLKPEPLLPPEP